VNIQSDQNIKITIKIDTLIRATN